MARYFLELSYKGTRYKGFQVQLNADTVQGEVEKALAVILREKITLTGSSRTDAGVHAWQNYFHFDYENELSEKLLYNLNAVLPADIAAKNIIPVPDTAHARFDAVGRRYRYVICREKDPFLQELAYYYPYSIDIEQLNRYASELINHTDFTSFSKRNTQVKTFVCTVTESRWVWEDHCLVYYVQANRFLRGMVRALVATMLKAARRGVTVDGFNQLVEARDCTQASFASPAHGLFLVSVNYPVGFLSQK